jgi:amidase
MDQVHYKSAVQLAGLIRRKKIGCLELLDHFLDRIEKYNPKLNAIVWTDRDKARKRARAADAALKKGKRFGPLHGVPMTIKESYQVAGSPTTWGVPAMKDNVTGTTAVAAQRMIDAGVTLFGKTNVPIMLADWQSYNAIYGTTNNPWDLGRTPGGSSGGSSAALSAGLTAIDAGSDIGSSIRNPAHYCGVFGHKPTHGLITYRGHALPGSVAAPDISVVGPLARSADDLDAALDIMAGADPDDGGIFRLALPKCPKTSLRQFRVAVKLSDPNCEVDGEYADQLQALVDKLAKAGCKVKEAAPAVDTERLHDVYVRLLRAATSARMADSEIDELRQAMADGDSDEFLARTVDGVTMPHRNWLKLNNERHQMRLTFNAFFKDHDILLCPVAASAAFPHNHEHEGKRWRRRITVNNRLVSSADQLFWAGYSGVVFLPSTVGPAGIVPSGLPVGYQAIAAQGRDKTSIAFARLVERECGGFTPPPGYD